MFALFKCLVAVDDFGGRQNGQLQSPDWAESLVLVSSQQDSPE